MADQPFIQDGVTALPGGINSNPAPQLLSKDTASFATNATFRGQFITNRPGVRKINLEFPSPPTPPVPPTPSPYWASTIKISDLNSSYSTGGYVRFVNAGFVSGDVTLSGTGQPTDVVLFYSTSEVAVGKKVSIVPPWGGQIIAYAEVQASTIYPSAPGQYTTCTLTLIPTIDPTTGNIGPFNGVSIPNGSRLGEIIFGGGAGAVSVSNVATAFSTSPNGQGMVLINTTTDIATYVDKAVLIQGGGDASSVSGAYYVVSTAVIPPPPPPPPPPPTPSIENLINELFQGCCYYKPLFGSESLMAAIGGRLFQFIIGPGTTSSAVKEGETYANFTAPAINAQAQIQVSSTYLFQIGQVIYVLPGATPSNQGDPNRFQIVSIAGNSSIRTLTVKNLGAVAGTIYIAGDFVSVFSTINDGTAFVLDRSISGDLNSATNPVNWLWQSERWVINNDGQKLPIFFDGVTSRRSVGNNQELPVGRMGAYVFGRNWVALPDGVTYMAGDIVGGSSGTLAYNFKDAVLKAVENTYLAGGGTFSIPGNLGEITAMASAITLDSSLGQGPLQVFTEFGAFSCNAPVNRVTNAFALGWQDVTNPIQTTSLIGGGAVGQDTVTSANGDLIFRSANPTNGFRSLILGRRDFNSWGNTPQSAEVQRALDADNKALLPYSSSIQFDNRMLGTCFPTDGPLGVYHQGMVALNFDPVSSLRGKAASIWDGLWTGLNVFKFVTGTFSGVQRAFAFVFNDATTKIELYELLPSTYVNNFDNETIPIPWSFESASLFQNLKNKGQFDLVEIQDGELHLGAISGTVKVETWYKPEFSECWFPWKSFEVCSTASYPKSYRSRLGLGQPDSVACNPNTTRLARIARSFQVRLAITGTCKVFGFIVRGAITPENKFADQVCAVEACSTNDPCLQFPLNNYSLNTGKKYTNDGVTITVHCPDGSAQEIFVQAGAVNLVLPWSEGFTGPVFPQIVLGCAVGGNIVRNVPDGSTQIQIDAIANEMIMQCATAIATSQAVNCQLLPSDEVYFVHDCSPGAWTYTGTPPAWITADAANSRLVGAAGQYTGVTLAEANAAAQAAIDAFGATALANNTLHCIALNWENLVWTLIHRQIANNGGAPCTGADSYSNAGSVFSNSVYANIGGACPSITNSSSVQTNATMAYTGPQQTCNLRVVVSGCTGNPDMDNRILFTMLSGLSVVGGQNHVPFVDGTYDYQFTIPAAVSDTVNVQVIHQSTYTAGGGCKWDCKLTTV